MTSYFRGKNFYTCLLWSVSWFKKFLTSRKQTGIVFNFKISTRYSYWVIYMIFIFKITEVKFCISLRKYPDVSLLQMRHLHVHNVHNPTESLFWQLFNSNFHKLILNDGHSENRIINILFKITLRALFAWRGSYISIERWKVTLFFFVTMEFTSYIVSFFFILNYDR